MSHYLTRHLGSHGARWVVNGRHLPAGVDRSTLLQLRLDAIRALLDASAAEQAGDGAPLPPIEHDQEVWASGVTYLRSREARMVESETKDIYDKVYTADRVEVFFKAIGWRVMGPGQPVRVRSDSRWNVPEPELTLVLNRFGDVVGYTAGNDMSSRDIEGENPLYLPQAKVYDGSCALGPGIVLADAASLGAIPIVMQIERGGECAFEGETSTAQLKRTPEEMAGWLTRELAFPRGVFLMTGTGLVPPDDFSLSAGDRVIVRVGDLVLENPVAG
ncbi:MAG: fumarylacetoacetate hydrolase family protein [Gammaproteobacteria bacterium]|nr:fumarylacetoacetate hydrolase family protein [Gammaproteobacteria bacterium]